MPLAMVCWATPFGHLVGGAALQVTSTEEKLNCWPKAGLARRIVAIKEIMPAASSRRILMPFNQKDLCEQALTLSIEKRDQSGSEKWEIPLRRCEHGMP